MIGTPAAFAKRACSTALPTFSLPSEITTILRAIVVGRVAIARRMAPPMSVLPPSTMDAMGGTVRTPLSGRSRTAWLPKATIAARS
jgi:hypothetical protein